MSRYLLFLVSCVFTHNLVLGRGMGAEALTDESRGIRDAIIFGVLVTIIMAISAGINWAVNQLLLVPLNATYLQIPAFVLVIALVSMVAEKSFGQKFPNAASLTVLMTANCAMLGAAVLNLESGCNLAEAMLSGLFGGFGFLVAIVLMAGVQERIRFSRIPEPMKGFPITLVSASLMALAFMGFMGIA